MSVAVRLLFVLSLLLTSCSTVTSKHLGCVTYWDKGSFPIMVSPDTTFDITDLTYVLIAIETWNSAVGEQVFVLRPNAMQSSSYDGEGVELTHTDLKKPLIGFCPVVYYPSIKESVSGRIFRGYCYIDMKDHPNDHVLLAKTVIHELGHALGFPHDELDPGSYMFPEATTDSTHFTKKHIEVLREMMHGTYKEKASRFGRCL